jgi:acyl-[acyl-carrier-protein]-phospholipid O-acyltransferase / long-chain-fatty-acid--[acyl-carrier-protein] ligase
VVGVAHSLYCVTHFLCTDENNSLGGVSVDSLVKGFLNGLYKVRIHGVEQLDLSTPCILAPNHVSLLDAVILAFNLPKEVVFVANTNIAKKFSFIKKFRQVYEVDPLNPFAVKDLVKAILKEGKSILLFPEGRITTTGSIMKIYSGLGFIAMKTGAPVYPISINGLERSVFSYMNDLWKTTLIPAVSIHIGKPYTIPYERGLSMGIQKRRAAQLVYKKMQEELFQSRMKPEVNLFNELLIAAHTNGPDLKIVEEITEVEGTKGPKKIVQKLHRDITYKELIVGSYVFAEKLKPLLEGQNRVGIFLPNSIGHIIVLFALFYMGKVPAILNFSMGTQTLLECCETAGIKTIITAEEFVKKGKFEHIIEAFEDDGLNIVDVQDVKQTVSKSDKLLGLVKYLQKTESKATTNELILFTSGSESKPKGVILTHRNIFANIQQVRSLIDTTSKDKMLNPLPMFHSFGLTIGTILPILLGIPSFTYPSPLHFRVVAELAYDRNATLLLGTPTFLANYARVAHHYDFYKMRYVLTGGEKLKDEIRDTWMKKFGIRIIEGYGTTETAPLLTANVPMTYEEGTVGPLIPGVEMKLEKIEGIDKGGNLLVKGPNIMKGYLIHGQGFVPAPEFYDTGDIVEITDQGNIKIVSRKKRFAKVAGEMVSLSLVESIASQCFQDDQMAAVNVPDKRKGEKIVLFTTNENAKVHQLKDYILSKGLSPLLTPSQIHQLKQIPLLGSGKFDYVTLKTIAEEVGT